MSGRYLTTHDVARLLMVSPGSVRLWSEKGWLPAQTTPGGHRRFLRRDVERFARERGLHLSDALPRELRVLIVDDEAPLVGFLAELLRNCGQPVAVETASDGFEAGQKIHAFQPHVVLLDLMMPGLDGFRACQRIKRDPATYHIRVVAMTGYYSEDNLRASLDAGADAVLAKPFERDALLAALQLDVGWPLPVRSSAAEGP